MELSQDAGLYLCNAVLYELVHEHVELPAAFVHVPLLPEQSERRGKGEASLLFEASLVVLRGLAGLLPEIVRPPW